MADSGKQPDTAEPVEPVVTPVKTVRTWRQVPVWGWVVGAIVLFFAIMGMMAACFSVLHRGDDRLITTSRTSMMQRGFRDDQSGQFSTGAGARGGFGGRMMGSTGTTTNATRVAGVVTAVDGSSITVAGNGTTTRVVVSDSTTYTGSSKPAAVNDTIITLGTKASDGTFTATAVRLTRQ